MKYKHIVSYIAEKAPVTFGAGSRVMYSDIENPTSEDIKNHFPELKDAKRVGVILTTSKIDGSNWEEGK